MITRKCLWTLLCVALLILVSCVKAPELTLTSSSSLELSVDGSSGSITFTANRDWSVICSDSWVTVSPSKGEASKEPVTVTVRCNANTTYEDRSATVTIRMEELSQTVTVRQPANLGIVLPTQAYNLTSDARSIEVEVKANVDYTVEVSEDWIKQTGTKGLVSKTLTFNIEENQTYDAREGKITIKSQNPSVPDQVITVKQAQKDAIIVKDTSFDMPYGGGEIEFKVEANVAFDVKTDSDWIHYVSTKALSTSTVKLKIDENATFSARLGKVEVTQQGGSLKHTITVNQAGRIAVTSIELDKTSLTLKPEETATLVATVKPDNATDKTVTWTSSDPEIATVDETGKVTAVKDGSSTITAKAGEKTAECKVTVKSSVYVGNAVDLGIVITKEDGSGYRLLIADCNLGTDKPEGYGDYYAWGETEQKADYTWITYGFRTSGDIDDNVKFSKYNTDTSYAPVDNKTVLDPEDDVAHVKLGGKWRMPTKAELDSLGSSCTWTPTTWNGVNGYEVKSKVNSNSIFLPVAGYRYGTELCQAGSYGFQWSSSLTNSPYRAYYFNIQFQAGFYSSGTGNRYYGYPVRPVLEVEIPVSSVELDKTTLCLKPGETAILVTTVKPGNATSKTVTWTSSDPEIATVDEVGKVTAIKDGTATITARAGEKSATCTVTVKTPEYVGNAVDLGITITRSDGTTYNLQWADCNLGTDKPEEFGDYYAWGETETKDIYTWETYKFRTSGDSYSNVKFSKYNTSSSYGPVDNKTVLDPEDDVAHVKLGGKWRMPTKAEQDALRSQCTWTWTTKNGVKGYEVKSKVNSNSIFLPAAGYRYGTRLDAAGSYGYCWSSSVSTGSPNYAYRIFFGSGSVYWDSYYRFYGFSVRPVMETAIPVTAVELDKTSLEMKPGETVNLVVTINPNNATDKTVTWTSSNPEIATVDANGKVTAIKEGTATIMAQAGEKTATCKVTVCSIPVTSVELNSTCFGMDAGDTATLVATVNPNNATDKTVTWTTSDASIASVDANGKVKAVKVGTATITAKAGEKSAECIVVVNGNAPDGAVNLGIVMTRDDGSKYVLYWAECNIGASKPEEYGDYYAWGETKTKSDYSWATYKWANGAYNKLTKYCPTDKTDCWDGAGSPDGKMVLDPEDDVAHVKLGGKWRMPTKAEQDALRSQCTWTWTTNNGVNGYEVKSKVNSNSIFLPATGSRSYRLNYAGSYGEYWSSSLSTTSPYDPSYAYDIYFYSYCVERGGDRRFYGDTVRPVTE